MADLDQLKRALINADRAGDVEGARVLAGELRKMMEAEQQAPKPENSLGHRIGAITDSVAQGLTFGFSDEIAAGLGTGFGLMGDYGEALKAERARMAQNRAANPGLSLASEIGGGVLTGAGLVKGGLSLAQRAAGQGLMRRMGAGAAEGAALGGLYGVGTAEEGERVEGGISGAMFGGGVGGAIPAVGAGLRGVGGAIYDNIAPTVRAAINPQQEASRRVGVALARDAEMPQGVLNATDESSAILNNQPLMNFDRGGETTRALTRSIANQSPESRGVIQSVVSNRFEGQGGRFKSVIERVAGGNVDDLDFQDQIREAAKQSNKAAYSKAYNAPNAKSLWDADFAQLFQSPAVRSAAAEVTRRSGNRAAIDGGDRVVNPFVFGADGRMALRRNADGSVAKPNLEFWDKLKQNIDGQIGVAKRSGDATLASELMQIKTALVNKLDATVPAYKDARAGAAKFFDAEDALSAGRKFVMQNKEIRVAARDMARFTPAEREAFKVGFAAEFSEKVASVGDRRNVIDRLFGSETSRKKLEMVFGPNGARELEQFVRLENAMDMMRNALGNSTTARQLAEMGIGAGVGGAYGGDWSSAAAGALAMRGAGMAANKINERAFRDVAKILLSNDRALIGKAAKDFAKSDEKRKALEAFTLYLERVSTPAAVGQAASVQ